MLTNERIIFIGAGHMGRPFALATAPHFIAAGYETLVVDSDPSKLAAFGHLDLECHTEYCGDATVLCLSVRPYHLESVAEQWLDSRVEVVVSTVAGVKADVLSEYFPSASIIRTIPNTPCELSEGCTLMYSPSGGADSDAFCHTVQALGKTGSLIKVDQEMKIDWATGLTGGGPAYFMLVAEALIGAGVELGFSEKEARTLVSQTMRGSGTLLRDIAEKSALEFASEVITPNGTTEQAIKILTNAGIDQTFRDAVKAASSKSAELGENMRGNR